MYQFEDWKYYTQSEVTIDIIDIISTSQKQEKGLFRRNNAEFLRWNIKEKKGKVSPDGEVLEKALCQGKLKMKKEKWKWQALCSFDATSSHMSKAWGLMMNLSIMKWLVFLRLLSRK